MYIPPDDAPTGGGDGDSTATIASMMAITGVCVSMSHSFVLKFQQVTVHMSFTSCCRCRLYNHHPHHCNVCSSVSVCCVYQAKTTRYRQMHIYVPFHAITHVYILSCSVQCEYILFSIDARTFTSLL